MVDVICVECGDVFTPEDLRDLHEMGERYHRERGCFFCPDCWDTFQRLPLEEQARQLLQYATREGG